SASLVTQPRLLVNRSSQGVSNAFQLRLFADPNQNYVIQATTDWASWTAVSTNRTDANGVADVAESSQFPQRFYRAVLFSNSPSSVFSPAAMAVFSRLGATPKTNTIQ